MTDLGLVVCAAGVGLACSFGACRSADKASPAPTSSARVEPPRAAVRPVFQATETYGLLGEIVRHERFYAAPHRAEAIDFLATKLGGSAEVVLKQTFDAIEPVSKIRYELVNIIGRQNPSASLRIVVGSHWDSRLWAEEDADPARRGKPLPGANDGGSGVAVLLELARMTKEFRAIGIDYVLFDGEEFGRPHSDDYCKGSRWFARQLASLYPSRRPVAAIVLDMVGDTDQDFYYEATSFQAARPLVEEVWGAAHALGHDRFHPAVRYHIVDDHTPFLDLGIPAMLLIDYDYPPWHTFQDTLDKVSPASLERVGTVLYTVLAERERRESQR